LTFVQATVSTLSSQPKVKADGRCGLRLLSGHSERHSATVAAHLVSPTTLCWSCHPKLLPLACYACVHACVAVDGGRCEQAMDDDVYYDTQHQTTTATSTRRQQHRLNIGHHNDSCSPPLTVCTASHQRAVPTPNTGSCYPRYMSGSWTVAMLSPRMSNWSMCLVTMSTTMRGRLCRAR
jgi:hypothetical protein